LTRVRIEKAMELLKISDMKVYEISEEIGYNDPHYFSLIFKKISGNTPSEFRERYEENGHVS
jgi:two-component system response regulator YesN